MPTHFIIFTYFLVFALSGFVAARLLSRGMIRKPLRSYAMLVFQPSLLRALGSFQISGVV